MNTFLSAIFILIAFSTGFFVPALPAASVYDESRPSSFPFKRDYLMLEALNNFPVSRSLDLFRPYRQTLGITYRHVLNRNWIVGVSAQFKSYRRKDLDREFALLSFTNQAQYVIRLYHPLYFFVGPKWLYLLASQKARFPLVRDPDFETEIGAGLTTSFAYIFREDWLLSLRLDRWRGTKTNRLHGFEVALGLAKSLKF